MSEALQKVTSQLPATMQEALVKLDEAASSYRELVRTDTGMPSSAIAQAYCMKQLRELLTPEIMEPIMSLQSCKLGFKTDKDTPSKTERNKPGFDWKTWKPGYPVEDVRDVTIWAMGRGASMTGNQVNIIAKGGYLTKEFFFPELDRLLGPGNWELVHEVPRKAGGGACVKTKVRWRTALLEDWQEQTLEHAIKGDDYATADAYVGKADRKCAAWLASRISGIHMPDADLDDGTIEIKAEVVEDKPETITDRINRKVREKDEPDHTKTILDAVGLDEDTICEFLRTLPAAKGVTCTTLKSLNPAKLADLASNTDWLKDAIGVWMDAQG